MDKRDECKRTAGGSVETSLGRHRNQGLPFVLGAAWKLPTYWPCGVRRIGGMTLIWAFVRNLRTGSVMQSVTGHTVFPRRCPPIFRPLSRIPFLGDWSAVLREHASGIGYSPCIGTSGIPTPEEQKKGIRYARQRRPGSLRVLCPRPPLRDFTKEMGLDFDLVPG